MPIEDRWWMFTETVVQHERDQPGVYELGTASGVVIYVGSSNELRRRLLEHLASHPSTCIKRNAMLYRVEYTPAYQARERQLYDQFVRTNGRPPACNSVRP